MYHTKKLNQDIKAVTTAIKTAKIVQGSLNKQLQYFLKNSEQLDSLGLTKELLWDCYYEINQQIIFIETQKVILNTLKAQLKITPEERTDIEFKAIKFENTISNIPNLNLYFPKTK